MVTNVELSPRQFKILNCIYEGKPSKEIASELGISDGTVKQHISAIYRRLEVNDKSGAIRKALEYGLVGEQLIKDKLREFIDKYAKLWVVEYIEDISSRMRAKYLPDNPKPVILAIKSGRELGRGDDSHIYAYTRCPVCKTPRWIMRMRAEKNPICRSCLSRAKAKSWGLGVDDLYRSLAGK
jgi:DNA-binding CsgD family transcriptional regulator